MTKARHRPRLAPCEREAMRSGARRRAGASDEGSIKKIKPSKGQIPSRKFGTVRNFLRTAREEAIRTVLVNIFSEYPQHPPATQTMAALAADGPRNTRHAIAIRLTPSCTPASRSVGPVASGSWSAGDVPCSGRPNRHSLSVPRRVLTRLFARQPRCNTPRGAIAADLSTKVDHHQPAKCFTGHVRQKPDQIMRPAEPALESAPPRSHIPDVTGAIRPTAPARRARAIPLELGTP